MRLDHLVVCCERLEEGASFVEERLGAAPVMGGKHALMSTHNMLLSLGPDAYLEVIAVDPEAPAPGRARWFSLDGFSGPPRLTNWVARSGDLATRLVGSPLRKARITALERGDLRWRMAVTDDGALPFDGLYPGMIEWQGDAHPAKRLPDHGLRLEKMTISHPRADDLSGWIAGVEPVHVIEGAPGISARFQGRAGAVRL